MSPHGRDHALCAQDARGLERGFPAHERAMLLGAPGIGETVVRQLESVGFDSVEHLRMLGVDRVLGLVQSRHGVHALRNRRRALGRVIATIGPVA
jgi:hypothetical protein